MYDDKVDGLISKETYLQKQAEYEQQLNDLIDAKQKHSNANINYLKLGFNIFELAQVGREVYEKQSTDNEKRELLNFVFSNFKLNGEKLVPTPQNGFDVVFARAQKGNWLRHGESNLDYHLVRIKRIHLLWKMIVILWLYGESNPALHLERVSS